jgi:hypothetical protein
VQTDGGGIAAGIFSKILKRISPKFGGGKKYPLHQHPVGNDETRAKRVRRQATTKQVAKRACGRSCVANFFHICGLSPSPQIYPEEEVGHKASKGNERKGSVFNLFRWWRERVPRRYDLILVVVVTVIMDVPLMRMRWAAPRQPQTVFACIHELAIQWVQAWLILTPWRLANPNHQTAKDHYTCVLVAMILMVSNNKTIAPSTHRHTRPHTKGSSWRPPTNANH